MLEGLLRTIVVPDRDIVPFKVGEPVNSLKTESFEHRDVGKNRKTFNFVFCNFEYT
jgi:hypothetical protein